MSSQPFLWPVIGKSLSLGDGDVHVFSWGLDSPPTPTEWKTLSEEESRRAQRFVFPRDRDRYVRAHATMRIVLAGYSGLPPGEIPFVDNAYGKPRIDTRKNPQSLRFNLSHSAGIAVLAVAREYELGVDVEILRPIGPDIAEHNFSARELSGLLTLAREEELLGFYRCWTSKEALLKGEGCGLNLPLDSFDVEVDPQRPAALLDSRPPDRFASGWLLFDLQPAHNTVATLAVHDKRQRITADSIHCFSLTP
ncbi:MAG: 4'-phosphopantetheinyl transferase superfamily protein [Acidobacteriaceae bacterium]